MKWNSYLTGATLAILVLVGIVMLGSFSGALAQTGLLSSAPQQQATPTPEPLLPGPMGPGGMMGQGGMMSQVMMGTMMGGPFPSTAKPIAMDEAVGIA